MILPQKNFRPRMERPGSSSLVGDPALATLAGRDDDDDDDDMTMMMMTMMMMCGLVYL